MYKEKTKTENKVRDALQKMKELFTMKLPEGKDINWYGVDLENKRRLKKNKGGIIGIIFFFLILFTIVIVGIIAAIVVGLVDYTSGEITPIMKELGMVGDTNLSQAAEYSFGTLDKVINTLPMLAIFGYVAMLVFSIIFVVSYKFNPNPVLIGVYLMFTILLIFGCIVLSNMYQDLYQSGDLIGTKLSEQPAMSYLILYSPLIMGIIAFIVGIYIFAGKQSESQGGFEI